MPVRLPLKTTLRRWPLALTIFFCVSGGPNGIEELISASGPGLALLLILVVPLVWAVPAALMTAELTSAIPAEGGYYVWVKRALGPAAGFLCAFWTWIYSWLDVAIYPVLFVEILASTLKLYGYDVLEDRTGLQWLLAVGIGLPFTWLNIRGIRVVGAASVLMSVAVLVPFLVMVAIGLPGWLADPLRVAHPFRPPDQSMTEALGGGLMIVMWNYLGWDSMSSVAGEVDDPQRSYPWALALAVPAITLVYFLPVAVGLSAFPDWTAWESGSWPTIAAAIGGPILLGAILIANLVSSLGLFNATALAASRIPFVLADDGYLPPALTRLHPRFGTPVVAILVCTVFYALFSLKSFGELVVADVFVYSAALMLEFVALIVLRIKEPDLPRPFRIPGGVPTLVALALAPAIILGIAVWTTLDEQIAAGSWFNLAVIGAALVLAPVLYAFVRRRPWAT